MNDEQDNRYPSLREHWGVVERMATVEAEMRQIAPALARIETMIATTRAPQQAPHQETAAALALHRALDALPKQQSGGLNTILVVLAIVGALAIGFMLAGIVTG